MVVARWTSLRCYLNGDHRPGRPHVGGVHAGPLRPPARANHRHPVGDLPGGLVRWFASDFAIENRVWTSQHPLGLLTRGGAHLPDLQPGTDRRARRFLSPSQKYEIWLQRVPGRGHDLGGRRPARGRPLHDHADPRGRPPRRPGGAGYLQAWGAAEPCDHRASHEHNLHSHLQEALMHPRSGHRVSARCGNVCLMASDERWPVPHPVGSRALPRGHASVRTCQEPPRASVGH
jgi:hypothetical protein